MKNQTFGVEIELTGITRKKASQVIANFFGTENFYIGSYYDTYAATDNKGRTWKAMHDGSIRTDGGQAVEIVTPVLKYDDIENLQEIVRQLRHSGAKANETCGIHIHIGSENHTAKTLTNLVNIMTSKQNLIYKALGIKSEREHYCKKLESGLSGKIKAYIQFCLAVNHQALTQKSASARVTETTNPKYTFRTWLLRLGLIGDEFKTARLHLLANLDGNTAWRNA